MTRSSLPAFSLLEVLFSVAFLILVGFAIVTVNVASLRLVTDSETKSVAYALNDEANSFLKLRYASMTQVDFRNLITSSSCTGGGCYLNCPVNVTAVCSFTAAPTAVQVGQSRLQFQRKIVLTEQPANSGFYLVKLTTSWGSGVNNQIATSYILQGT